MTKENILLLGIDGGATKISGWIVDKNKNGFSLTDTNVQKKYSEYPGFDATFKPVDLKTQLREMNSEIALTDEEKEQGLAYMNAAADVIMELAKMRKNKKLLIGFGMPGLKTMDKRGISALANGPRMPVFVEFIEAKLKDDDIDFYPVSHLGSDADYCGIGEEYDVDGMFRNTENAYYLGGGTGVADAMKLRGELVTFDSVKSWIAKTWEMKTQTGLSLERYASAGGIQFLYSVKSGLPIDYLNKNNIYPPQILQKAIEGDDAALDTINEVSKNISRLVFERISTIYFGYSKIFDFVNPAKPPLLKEHPYRGILLDRIVVGQRLGDLLQESKSGSLLWKEILTYLGKMVAESSDDEFTGHYLKSGIFDESVLTISGLREAPVIGAAVDAFLSNKNLM